MHNLPTYIVQTRYHMFHAHHTQRKIQMPCQLHLWNPTQDQTQLLWIPKTINTKLTLIKCIRKWRRHYGYRNKTAGPYTQRNSSNRGHMIFRFTFLFFLDNGRGTVRGLNIVNAARWLRTGYRSFWDSFEQSIVFRETVTKLRNWRQFGKACGVWQKHYIFSYKTRKQSPQVTTAKN